MQVSFSGSGASQRVEVRGPVDPPVVGAMMNEVSSASPTVSGTINTSLGTATGTQAFAGPRDDSFFIDLEAAFSHPPGPEAVRLARSPRHAHCRPTRRRRSTSGLPVPAVNYVNGFNVLAIVVELPSSLIENGQPGKLGIWGTISR